MKKYFKYLKYVIRHKWFVLLECFRVGIPWRGIIHDLSKFLPSEFFPYANHFYGEASHHKDGSHAPREIKTGRDETGYYKPTDTGDLKFDFAWLLHQKRNRHHWQWWILPEDQGGMKVLAMPEKVILEMLCDWRGAGRAQHNKTGVKEWYVANREKMLLDFTTELRINGLIRKYF